MKIRSQVKTFLALCALGMALSAFPQEPKNLIAQTTSGAEGVSVSVSAQDNGAVWFKEKDGHLIGSASVEGKDADRKALKATVITSPDFMDPKALCLQFDTNDCLKGNRDAVVVRLHGLKDEDAVASAGKSLRCELWIKASVDGAPCTLFLEGDDGKHYYKAVPLLASQHWSKLSLDLNQASPTLKKLWIRLDLKGKAIYTISSPSVSLKEEATPSSVSRNFILNGGAENGWNAISVLDASNCANFKGELLSYKQDSYLQPPYSEWVIDDKTAYSGRHSFKCIHRSTEGAHSSFYFNPVPFELGKPACFTIMMKADRKCQGGLGLFIANGIAYGKSVALDTQWRKFTLEIPEWGKPFKGIAMIGDVKNGYGCPLGLAYPRIDIPEKCEFLWLDDAAYSMASTAEPTHNEISLRGQLDKGTAAYQPDDTINAGYEIENASATPAEIDLTLERYNYFGQLVSSSPAGSLKLAPGEIAKKDCSFKASLLGPENLLLKATDKNSGKTFVHSTYFGVYKRAEKLHYWFGINTDPRQNAKRLSGYLKDFGIGSLRLWEAYNEKLNKSWGFDDAALYKKEGFYTLMCLEYGPCAYGSLVPVDLTPYGEYLSKLAKEHKGEIDCYEILNEVNIWGARTPIPDPAKFTHMSVDRYVDTLAVAHKALKGVDPSVKIAGPTTCHTDVAWTASVLEKGGAKYLDIITEHPYRERPENPDYERDILGMRAAIEKCGKKLPVYADECGEIMPQAPDGLLVTEKVRDHVARSLRMQLIAYANGIEKYFHFSVNLQNVGSCWSILYLGNPSHPGDVAPNPYLYAIRTMQERLDGSKPIGRIDVGSAFRCYAHERDGKRILSFWKCQEEDRPSTVKLSKKVDFTIFDIMGNPIEIKDNSFAVTPSPCYIETALKLDELKELFATSSISGVGLPFSLGVAIQGENAFTVDVENRINTPISGKLHLSSADDVVVGEKSVAFKNIAPNATLKMPFKTSTPIGLAPKPLKVKAVLDNGSAFDVKDFLLRAMLCPKAEKSIKIDGDLSDWPQSAKPMPLTVVKDTPSLWKPEDDAIKGYARACWNNDGLYIAVEVEKPGFFPEATVNGLPELYKGDSLQIAFDTLKDGKVSKGREHLYTDDDFEYDAGIYKGAYVVYRRYASSARYDGLAKDIGLLKGEVEMSVKSVPGKIIYELKFPQSAISPCRLETGSSMRWDVIANLNNGQGRMGWLELTRGIGQCKSPGDFMEIIFVDK